MIYIKFKVPDALKKQIKNIVSTIARSKGSKIKKGMNDVTMSIERVQAKLVIMAEDVSPPEILFHIPILCEEKKIPYGYISTRKELKGESTVAIEEVGIENEGILDDIIKKLYEFLLFQPEGFIFCQYCGEKIRETSIYCEFCGSQQ